MKKMKLVGMSLAAAICVHGAYAAFDVRDYGAVGDGAAKDTAAIQKAIDEAGRTGGGRVVLPSGTFRSGTIYLRSGVELHLEMGARLLGSDDFDDYNPTNIAPWNRGSTNEGWSGRHLIYTACATNVAITGNGTIDGNGRAFFDVKPNFVGKIGWRDGGRNSRGPRAEMNRPGQMIEFVHCKDIVIRDVTFYDSTAWSCWLWNCEDVRIRGVRVDNAITHLNTDGFDIDSCRNVTISDCVIRTGDDAFAIRGAGERLGLGRIPCENITIDNCTCCVSADGVRVGVGTGIIRHVRISNLVIAHAGIGLHVQPVYGNYGGVDISDICFSNISIRDAAEAINIMGHERSRPRGIAFSDIVIEENDIVKDGKMVVVQNADGVILDNVRIYREGIPPRELTAADVKSVEATAVNIR